MQERRTTIRIAERCRAQYCPADDLLPRDGAVLNLSERGAGVEVREAHRIGERVTVNFLLPDDGGPLTATGVVRWSDVRTPGRRRCRMGLEWLPIEEAGRSRLQRFLYSSTQESRLGRRTRLMLKAWKPAAALRRAAVLTGIVLGPLVVILLALRLLSLQAQNDDLQRLNEERIAIISHLELQQRQLSEQLGAAKDHLAATAGEVARLDQQAQQLEGSMSQLHSSLGEMQGAYDKVRSERTALERQVLELEQTQSQLTRRLRANQQLRQLVLEMIKARRQPFRRLLPQVLADPLLAQRPMRFIGNRGYVILDGTPTATHSIMWIKVHDPIADADVPLGPAPSTDPPSTPPSPTVPAGQ